MRILYLTQWFDPEPNVIKGPAFVRALAAAGHEVTVVTGYPNYPTGRIYSEWRPLWRCLWPRREPLDGATLVRLPLYPSHDANALRRSLNYLSFFLTALLWCLRHGRRFDLVYAYHPPITVGLAAALAGMVHCAPLVLDVQDLWPDTLAATGMRGARGLMPLLARACAFTYRRSALVLAQSHGMADLLAARGVPPEKLAVLHNWADDAHTHPAESETRAGAFTIVYGGNLGLAQGLESVIDAMHHCPQARLLIHGEGVARPALERRAANMANVRIAAPVPRAEMASVFRNADALLLHLRPDPLFDVTIPSKVQAYLASGRPIIGAVAGDAAHMLAQSGAAILARPGDVTGIAAAIRKLAAMPAAERAAMGRSGRAWYDQNCAFAPQIARLANMLEALA